MVRAGKEEDEREGEGEVGESREEGREWETIPNFFGDAVYQRMKPSCAITSCFTTGWLEGGFVSPGRGSILVYFEVGEKE